MASSSVMFHVYMLRCSDGAFYVGMTADLDKRVTQHNAGTGSMFTARRRPVSLVFAEQYPARSDAIRRERQLKGWTRAKKAALIGGNIALLKRM
jgi:predicted GIY-YIG superfamily endonuclease